MAEQITILCVDDEWAALALRRAVLQKFGYRVLTATSGREALDILDHTRIDLVLSDLLMPGIAGSELARKVKERDPGIPVVIVSGVNEIPSDAKYADLFISKLEGPVALHKHVQEVLQREGSAQETA